MKFWGYFFYWSTIVACVIACGTFVWKYELELVEVPYVKIQAPVDNPDDTEPIHGSHVVRQTLGVTDSFNFSRISIPFYVRKSEGLVWVVIREQGQDIVDFEYDLSQEPSGFTELSFVPDAPITVTQDLDVVISSDVPNAEYERAGAVFIEKADYVYSLGNYFVGDNEKQGDVGMTLFEMVSRYELLWKDFSKRPIDSLAYGATWVFVISFGLFLYYRVVQFWFR